MSGRLKDSVREEKNLEESIIKLVHGNVKSKIELNTFKTVGKRYTWKTWVLERFRAETIAAIMSICCVMVVKIITFLGAILSRKISQWEWVTLYLLMK